MHATVTAMEFFSRQTVNFYSLVNCIAYYQIVCPCVYFSIAALFSAIKAIIIIIILFILNSSF